MEMNVTEGCAAVMTDRIKYLYENINNSHNIYYMIKI